MTTNVDVAPEGAGTAAVVERSTAEAPLSVRFVERVGRRLTGGPGLSRRRFIGRVTIVSAALAVGPLRYLLKPGTAYAQVCGDGASCGSGWTAFCCTINNGANTCPPGSYVAGWWRIDDSPFCFNAPRYVIDCNRSPGSTCTCRCASGTCDQRRVCCNNFRYGQCNTQIPGVTEVVCRVVTCTAPWVWDPACSTTQRVDNRTRSHNAPCLPGTNATRIDLKYQDMGMTGSVLGAPTGPEGAAARGGRYRRYVNGTIFWIAAHGARALYGPINDAHRATGGSSGPLGYPTTDVTAVGDGAGRLARFEQGSVYHRTASVPAVAVHNPVDTRFRNDGGPTGALGYPSSTTRRPNGQSLTRFQNGVLAAAGSSVVRTRPEILTAAEAAPAGSPDRVGWPIAEEQTSGGTPLQRYETGIVTQRTNNAWVAIGDDLAARYLAAGGPGGSLGRPSAVPLTVAGGRGRELPLASGAIFVGPGTGARVLTGAILTAYRAEGGPNGTLGLPTSEEATTSGGQRRASFEGGAIVIEPGGAVSIVRPRTGRTPGQLTGTSPSGSGGRTRRTPGDLTP